MKVFTRLPVLLTTFGAWRKTPASLRCTSCQTSPSNCHTSLERILRKNGESREGKETETTDRMTKELKRMISSHCLKSLAMTCWKMQWKKASPNRKCRKTNCGSQNAITAIWQVHHGKYKLWFTIYDYILHHGKYKLWPPSMMAQALVFFFEPIIPVLGSSCVKNKNTNNWNANFTSQSHCRPTAHYKNVYMFCRWPIQNINFCPHGRQVAAPIMPLKFWLFCTR